MGNVNTNGNFSDPPWTIARDLGEWNFIKENSWWPFVHVLNPFTLHMYTRSSFLSILALFLNEVLETIVRAASKTDSIVNDQIAETPLDSMFGDILNGLLGIAMADIFLKAIHWKYHFLPYQTTRKSTLGLVVKYFVQFVLINLPLNFSGITFGNGHYSLGYIIQLGWGPLFIFITFIWNRYDPLWMREIIHLKYGDHPNAYKYPNNIKDLTLKVIDQFESTQKQIFVPGIKRFYLNWGIFSFLFTASFFYRYTHTFLMSVIHATITILILQCIFYFHIISPSPQQKKKRSVLDS